MAAVNSNLVTGVTYGGVSMTPSPNNPLIPGAPTTQRYAYQFYLLNPASGANNFVFSASSSTVFEACAADYTGVGAFDASNSQTITVSAGAPNVTVTTVADNCWAIFSWGGYAGGANTPSAGSGLTQRSYGAAFRDNGIGDSNGVIHPAGAHSMTENINSSPTSGQAMAMSFSPAGGAPPAATLMVPIRRTIYR